MSNKSAILEPLMKEGDNLDMPEQNAGRSTQQQNANLGGGLPRWLHLVTFGFAIAAVMIAGFALDKAYSAAQKSDEQQQHNLGQQHHAQTMRRVDQLISKDPLCATSSETRLRCLELVESVERMSSVNASSGSAHLVKQIESGALSVGDTHMLAVIGEDGGVVSPGNAEDLDREYVLSLAAPAFNPDLCSYIWDETFCLAHYHHNNTGSDGIALIILDRAMTKVNPQSVNHRGRRFYYDGTLTGLEHAAHRGLFWGAVKGGIHGAFIGAKTGGFGAIGSSARHHAEWGAVKGGFRGAVHYVRHHFHSGSRGHRQV